MKKFHTLYQFKFCKTFIIYFLLTIIATPLYSQKNTRYSWLLGCCDLDDKFVSKKDVIKFDKNKLLDYAYFLGDSLQTVDWKNKLWFLYGANDDCAELFCIDSILRQVTSRCFNIESIQLNNINVFNDRLILISNCSQTENVRDFGLTLIDDKKNSEEKYIEVRKKCLFYNFKILSDSLYIKVQPAKAELNYLYYFTFWMPRGRPEKYDYIDDGALELYVYDKDLRLVRKELIKN